MGRHSAARSDWRSAVRGRIDKSLPWWFGFLAATWEQIATGQPLVAPQTPKMIEAGPASVPAPPEPEYTVLRIGTTELRMHRENR